MRVSWYGDTGVAVFSIWQGGRCSGTFRLPVDEMARMVETLRRGPDDPPPQEPEEPGHRPGRRRRGEPDGRRGDHDAAEAAPGYDAEPDYPPPAAGGPVDALGLPVDPLGPDYRVPETDAYRTGGSPAGRGGDGTRRRRGDSGEYPRESRPGGWPPEYPDHDGQPYAADLPYSEDESYPESQRYTRDEPYSGGSSYGGGYGPAQPPESGPAGRRAYDEDEDDRYRGDRPYVPSQSYDGEPYAEGQRYEDSQPYSDGVPYRDGGPYSDSRPYRDSQPYGDEDDDPLPYSEAPAPYHDRPYQDPR